MTLQMKESQFVLTDRSTGRLTVLLLAMVAAPVGGGQSGDAPATAAQGAGHTQCSAAERRQQVMAAMQEAFGSDRHQIAHAMQVLNCAERLLQISDLKADPLTVAVAAILHDIGRCREGTTDHEQDGAVVSRELLKKLDFDADFTAHIARIVGSHHSAKGIDTPEFRIVWIADQLVNQKRDHEDPEELKHAYAEEAESLTRKIASNSQLLHHTRP